MLPEQAKLWFAPTSPPTAILQKFLLNRAEFVGRSNGSTWWRKTAGTSRWETCFEKIEGLFWALLSQSRWANSRLELVAFLLPPEQPSWHQGTAEQLRKDSGYDRPACITRALFFFLFWLHCRACRTSRPGSKPAPPAVEAQNLDHWTTREAHQGAFCYDSCKLFSRQNTVTWPLSLRACVCPLWRGWTDQAVRIWLCLVLGVLFLI